MKLISKYQIILHLLVYCTNNFINMVAYMFLTSNGFFFQLSVLVSSTACITSRETAEIVTECPQTQTAWEAAAVTKNCEQVQNPCSSFVYHCVMNTWNNQTIEVCAPKEMILGM